MTHVLREALSPITDGIDVWTMWCGEQCLAFPDGALAPEGFDFYDEAFAHKASCQPCKGTMRATSRHASETIPA